MVLPGPVRISLTHFAGFSVKPGLSTFTSPKAEKHVPIFGIAALDLVKLFMMSVQAY